MGSNRGGRAGSLSSGVPLVRPVPAKMPEERVDEIWADIYHQHDARVYTPEARPYSDGVFNFTNRNRKKPDLVVVPTAFRLRGNFFDKKVYRRKERIAVVQENKKGDDIHQLAEAMEDLCVYEEAARQGIEVNGTRLIVSRLIFAAGSYPSAQAPFFHDHEKELLDDFHFYDKIPEFKDYAIGSLMMGALLISRKSLSPRIGFVFFNPRTQCPCVFIAPGECYDLGRYPEKGPLDRFIKKTSITSTASRAKQLELQES